MSLPNPPDERPSFKKLRKQPEEAPRKQSILKLLAIPLILLAVVAGAYWLTGGEEPAKEEANPAQVLADRVVEIVQVTPRQDEGMAALNSAVAATRANGCDAAFRVAVIVHPSTAGAFEQEFTAQLGTTPDGKLADIRFAIGTLGPEWAGTAYEPGTRFIVGAAVAC